LNKIQEHGTSVVVQACALGPEGLELVLDGRTVLLALFERLKYIQRTQRMTVIHLKRTFNKVDIKI